MSTEHNLQILSAVIEEGFNRGNYPALDALFQPDYVEHQFGLHAGLENFKRDIQGLRGAFPDLHLTIEDSIAQGEMVWIRMTATGTHLGPSFGPPTGRTFSIAVFDACRFADGRIAEHWGAPDRFAQMHQLGLLPQPAGQRA